MSAVSGAGKRAINAIILGAPGGGKGTISKKLVKTYQFQHVSTGDLLRAHVQDEKSELGRVAKDFMRRGALVPDELVLNMLQADVQSKQAHRLLLDGFPRNIPQADALGKFLPLQLVLVLDIPHATIVERISNRMIHPASGRIYNQTYNPEKNRGFDDLTGEPLVQRDDDKAETVLARLQAYDRSTAPLIDYYSKRESHGVVLKRFAGTESDVIFPQMCDWLQSAKVLH
jgi:nucleoside-triphosphate--adenylate kinase